MKKRFAVFFSIAMLLALTQSAFAWSVSGLKTWYTKSGNTGFEVTIHDPKWEVADRYATITFYNSKRRFLKTFGAAMRDGAVRNFTWEDYKTATTFVGNSYKVKGFLKGKVSGISSVSVSF